MATPNPTSKTYFTGDIGSGSRIFGEELVGWLVGCLVGWQAKSPSSHDLVSTSFWQF